LIRLPEKRQGKEQENRFWKDPSTRGNSPIFTKQKETDQIFFSKPSNKYSPIKFKFFNLTNLVKSMGI